MKKLKLKKPDVILKNAIKTKANPSKKRILAYSKKSPTSKVSRAASMVKKVVQNNIDASLLKLSPNMQKTLDSIISKIEQTPLRIQDFQALACRILKHANEINETLKQKTEASVAKLKAK
jgi:hypothetical protein